MFRSLVLIASLVAAAHAYSTGAPSDRDICRDMTPRHHTDPQTEASPYTVTLSESLIHAGDRVKVTLEGKNGELFKGFLVQARVGDTIIGSFDVDSTDPEVQTIDCPDGKKNAVTHRSSKDKGKVSFDWVAPADSPSEVVFKATLVKDGGTFWVGQTSKKLTVQQ